MHRIYRSWAAGRDSQLFTLPLQSYHHCLSFLHNHVSVKRLQISALPNLLAPFQRRPFTKSHHAELATQAAQPSRENDEECDDTAQQSSSPRITLYIPSKKKYIPSKRSIVLGQEAIQDDALQSQISSTESHVRTPHHNERSPSLAKDARIPVTIEDFAASSGFWPSQTIDPSLVPATPDIPSVEVKPFQPLNSKESEQTSSVLSPRTDALMDELWRAQPRRGKIDLSYWDPVRGERLDTYPTQPKLDQQMPSSNFRDTTRSRMLVAVFAEIVYPHISSTTGLTNSAAHVLLTHPVFAPVRMDADVMLSILNWTWIVVAPPALRIKRLIYLSRSDRGQITPDIPQWLVLQLLRSDHIDAEDLVDLLNLIDQKVSKWALGSSLMILVVRLLRHARLSHPACLSRIVTLFMRLLDENFPSEPRLEGARRRAHWCNRMLTLLAAPVRSHPFKHVVIKQDAQLLLLHYMHDVTPIIPLNREGYRALVKLQLMHAKTDAERMWTQVQTRTWPPWEQQHQMGVASQPRTSPGSMSRTNLVLQRMKEDGYSPHTFDIAAQIIGGRDSDGSPTAQVRRASASIPSPRSWLPGPGSDWFDKSTQVWIARITATRTVREAWMGFCAYESAVEDTTHAVSVYHAMFQKLWADTLAWSDTGPLPGDGLENFTDPELARDLVHVSEEPPSLEGLYNRMKSRGIKPSGLLLRDLLLQEADLYRGLGYIGDSPMNPANKAILANPMDHSPMQVGQLLGKLHKDTVEAYVRLLTRPHSLRTKPMLYFESDISREPVCAPAFALRMLYHTRSPYYSVWTEYFAALSQHGLSSETDQRRISMKLAWKLMCDGFALEDRRLDASVLPHLLLTARSVQVWASQGNPDNTRKPLDVSMKVFLEVLSGARHDNTIAVHKTWHHYMRQVRPSLHSVPTADSIQEMAFLMVTAQSESIFKDMLDLLHWARAHQELLATVSTFTKRNLAALRVYVEGQWAIWDPEFMDLNLEVMVAEANQVNEARKICQELGGWASDEDVGEYLQSSHYLFTTLKHKLKEDAKII